jgi:type IV pilus assembly protein PilN
LIKINLLAEGKRPAAVRKAAKPTSVMQGQHIALWALLAAVFLMGVLPALGWWWVKRQEVATNVERIAEAQAEVDELEAIIREVEEYKAKQAELEHKIAVITDLRQNQSGPVWVMDHVSRSLPELLWLDRMQMQSNVVTLTGRAFNSNAVASFIDNLDHVPEFQEPNLRDLVESRNEGVYTFTVNFNFSRVKEAGGATEDDGAADEAADTTAGAAGG